MKYYKFTKGLYLNKAPYIIPKNSLFTEYEMQKFRLFNLKHFTEVVEVKRSEIYFFAYDFRFMRGE